MPLWLIACPIICLFYDQKKTGSAVYVNVNGEQKYGVYQADGTIMISFRRQRNLSRQICQGRRVLGGKIILTAAIAGHY
jgi:hypothetical protein